MPGCCQKLDYTEEKLPFNTYSGTWIGKKDPKSKVFIDKPCLCYSCACFSRSGCIYSAVRIWTCSECGGGNKNYVSGDCISMSLVDKDTLQLSWCGCPSEEYVRHEAVLPMGGPESQEMER
eukprot:6214431-Pleurochrysis_carterae.AAC.1